MSTDIIQATALVLAVVCVVAGTYLIGGSGVALCVFGGLLMAGVVYARTRAIELRREITDVDDID